MERLLLWFLEGLAEGQGGPQARRREAPPKRTGGPPARRNGGRPAARNRRLAGICGKRAEPLPVRAEAFGQVARGGFPEPGPGSLTRRKAGKKDDAVPSVSEA